MGHPHRLRLLVPKDTEKVILALFLMHQKALY